MITDAGCIRGHRGPPTGEESDGKEETQSVPGEQHRRPECLQAVGGLEERVFTPAVSTTIAHAEAIGTRRGSRPAIAAHGVNHPAYWREKTGEHASTAQSDERRDAD
jgi:hypothetical protein